MTDAADRAEAKHARRIAAAFREAVAKARARVDRKALVDAIARGDRQAARNILAAALGTEFRAVEAAWGHAAADQGKVAADEAPDLPVRKRLTFNFLSGRVAATLGGWAAQLGRSLLALAMQAVDAVLGPGMAERAPPQQLADDLIAVMGLSPRDAAAVAAYRARLANLSRDALRSQLRDARNDPRILSAIREDRPLPPEYVDKLVARYADRLEASRARMIGRTEALRARWTGVTAAWQQQVDAGLVAQTDVRLRWLHRHDDRVRHAHRAIPQMNPDGVVLGEAFASPLGMIFYPGDPAAPIANTVNCRCVLQVTVRTEARVA